MHPGVSGQTAYRQRVADAYPGIRPVIVSRLAEFADMWLSGTDDDILAELVFCILTPQSRARACWSAVEALRESGLLLRGNREDIARMLRSCGVRFHNTKAIRVLDARRRFSGSNSPVRKVLEGMGPAGMRDWLVANVCGMGYKEATHFLRNMGLAGDMAILDRHILRNMQRLGAIGEIPASITKARYLELEARFLALSGDLGIPPEHLDMLLWYMETGEVFK